MDWSHACLTENASRFQLTLICWWACNINWRLTVQTLTVMADLCVKRTSLAYKYCHLLYSLTCVIMESSLYAQGLMYYRSLGVKSVHDFVVSCLRKEVQVFFCLALKLDHLVVTACRDIWYQLYGSLLAPQLRGHVMLSTEQVLFSSLEAGNR